MFSNSTFLHVCQQVLCQDYVRPGITEAEIKEMKAAFDLLDSDGVIPRGWNIREKPIYQGFDGDIVFWVCIRRMWVKLPFC